MSLLVSSRNLVHLKWFWFQDHNEFQSKTTQSKASTFKFPQGTKPYREWVIKMKKIALCPQSIRTFVQNTLPKAAPNKIFWFGVLMEPYFKLCRLVLKKDVVPTSLWKVESQQLDKKQADNACWTVGKLLGHFSGKIKFVILFKTFP